MTNDTGDDRRTAAPRPEVANRVVAWHNRHPLARRIVAGHVRNVGLVVLPFAAPGSASTPASQPEPSADPTPSTPHEDSDKVVVDFPANPFNRDVEPAAVALQDEATPPATDEAMAQLALGASEPLPAEPMYADAEHPAFVAAARRKPWWKGFGRSPRALPSPALFTEALIPEIGARGMAELARHHGLPQRPRGEGWPERVAELDHECLSAAAAQGLHGRVDRLLLTATIDDGTRRLRLLIGEGLRPVIVGPRLWDRQRVSAAAGLLVLSLAGTFWQLGRQTGEVDALERQRASAPLAAVSVPPGAAVKSSASAIQSASTAASAAASGASPAPMDGAESALMVSAVVASAPPSPSAKTTTTVTASATVAASAPPAEAASATVTAAAPEPTSPKLPASASTGTRTPEPTVGPMRADLGTMGQHRSIVPNLRPQLAAAVQTATRQQFALVSAPLHSRAEAEALLRRLQAETSRLHHPVAVETATLNSAKGWRVSWWPFAGRKQAENAQAVLANRRIDMAVVEL